MPETQARETQKQLKQSESNTVLTVRFHSLIAIAAGILKV